MEYIVEMRGITKRFGALVANERVDLHVRAGTLHAIVGENGAGKTTLMRILYGYYLPDEGEIYLKGRRVRFSSPADAIAHGVGMVSQHYSIIPELSILDNLMLGAEVGGVIGILNRQAARQRAKCLAQSLEFEADWNRPAETLSVAARQKLEILKLLWRNAEILILDEPTAMLSPADVQTLFEVLLRLKAEGRTILLVTHKLQEVLDYADMVTVLRGGCKVAEAPVGETDAATLTRWIVGEETAPLEPPDGLNISDGIATPPRLTIESLFVRSDRGGWGVQELDLRLAPGEVFGLAGVDGNGQQELVEALAGLRPVARGRLLLDGMPFENWSPARRLQAGVRFLFDDRFRRGMIASWSVMENAILGAQREVELQRFGWLRPRAVRQRAQRLIERFQVKVPSLRAPMTALSGGNQQRLVVARTLYGQPRLLVAYAPTRGLDIRGTEATYYAIREACRQGMAALILSLDLDELMDNCDRIGVLYRGRVVKVFGRDEFSREAIGAAMVGVSK
ncbi:MAG: ABC transporter ATP-binding protein [Fimbriimonadales bacterium]|nr:ABC transporter ATP-binding protein [Fimbriimonadales bacterium]